MKITAGAISAAARTRRLSKTSAPRLIRLLSATATTWFLPLRWWRGILVSSGALRHGRDLARGSFQGLRGRHARRLRPEPGDRGRGTPRLRRAVRLRKD